MRQVTHIHVTCDKNAHVFKPKFSRLEQDWGRGFLIYHISGKSKYACAESLSFMYFANKILMNFKAKALNTLRKYFLNKMG